MTRNLLLGLRGSVFASAAALAILGTACKDSNTVSGAGGGATTFAISGIVRRGGVPTGGISIVLRDSEGQMTTTSLDDGSYRFEGVPAGTCNIVVKTGCLACVEDREMVRLPPDAVVDLVWEQD